MASLFLTSRLLAGAGAVHGFTARGGGVSQGPFASLNLSRAVGDEPQAVAENFARLAAEAGLAGGEAAFATAAQIHGDRVLAVRRASAGVELIEVFPESEAWHAPVSGERRPAPSPAAAQGAATAVKGAATAAKGAATAAKGAATAAEDAAKAAEEPADAVLALEPGVAAAVRVADCVPILLLATDRGAVAAVHSGWRGARLSIAARGVRALQQAALADPGRALAAVGPCIGRCCYEVSPELAQLFRGLFGAEVADDPARPKPHLDLRLAVERALLRAGLKPDRIEQVGGCTSCDSEGSFSHRRDAGRTGRHLAFIAAP